MKFRINTKQFSKSVRPATDKGQECKEVKNVQETKVL